MDLSSDLGDLVTVSRGLLSIPYFCLIVSRTFSLATSSRSLCFCLSFWKALRAFSLNRKKWKKPVKWQNLKLSHLVFLPAPPMRQNAIRKLNGLDFKRFHEKNVCAIKVAGIFRNVIFHRRKTLRFLFKQKSCQITKSKNKHCDCVPPEWLWRIKVQTLIKRKKTPTCCVTKFFPRDFKTIFLFLYLYF